MQSINYMPDELPQQSTLREKIKILEKQIQDSSKEKKRLKTELGKALQEAETFEKTKHRFKSISLKDSLNNNPV